MVDNPKKTLPMLFDVTKAENNESKTVDLGEFFSRIEVVAIEHNRQVQVRDIYKNINPVVNVRVPLILKIRRRKHSIDWILSHKLTSLSFVRVLLSRSTIRLKILDVTTPLKNTKEAIDVRSYNPLVSERTYPDIFVPPPSIQKQVIRTAKKWVRPVLKITTVFALTCGAMILLTLGIVEYIKSSTEDAYRDLIYIAKNIQNDSWFKKGAYAAENKLSRSLLLLRPFSFVFDNRFIRIGQIHTATAVIEGGRSLARSAILVSTIRDNLASEILSKSGSLGVSNLLSLPANVYPTDLLKSQKPLLEVIDNNIQGAIASYSTIQTLGNPALDEKFQETLPLLQEGKKALWILLTNFDTLLQILGDDRPKTYLILNQNRDEIRANGGFIGSVIVAEIYKWHFNTFEKHDVYDYDWKLFPYKENPPEGINKITNNFGLRDANYFPDLHQTFDKVNFFFEKAGGRTLDGLFTINQGLVIDLLRIVGPIELGDTLSTIDADNFSTVMSILVEAKIIPYIRNADGTYISPKDLLFTFIDQLKIKLIEKAEWKQYLSILKNHLKNGEIGIVFRDENIDRTIGVYTDRAPWKSITKNWIYPVFTSISGNKSDRYIDRDLTIGTTIGSGCSIITNVKLTQEHTFSIIDESNIRKLLVKLNIGTNSEIERIMAIQGKDTNRSYVRFLVPQNAKLISTNGIKLTSSIENNAGVFAGYTTTELRGKSSLNFSYITEPKTCSRETIVIKQPWLTHFNITIDGTWSISPNE